MSDNINPFYEYTNISISYENQIDVDSLCVLKALNYVCEQRNYDKNDCKFELVFTIDFVNSVIARMANCEHNIDPTKLGIFIFDEDSENQCIVINKNYEFFASTIVHEVSHYIDYYTIIKDIIRNNRGNEQIVSICRLFSEVWSKYYQTNFFIDEMPEYIHCVKTEIEKYKDNLDDDINICYLVGINAAIQSNKNTPTEFENFSMHDVEQCERYKSFIGFLNKEKLREYCAKMVSQEDGQCLV